MIDFILTLLFGWAGYYRFKHNQIGLGIFYLLTVGAFGIGWIVDIIISINKDLIPYLDNQNKLKSDNFNEHVVQEVTNFNNQNSMNNTSTNDFYSDYSFLNDDFKSFLLDTELNYIKVINNEELVSICENFVNKKLSTGLYLEYYVSYIQDDDKCKEVEPEVVLDEIKPIILKHNFANRDVKLFFTVNYVNYAVATIRKNLIYSDEIYANLEDFNNILANLNPNEFENLIIDQWNEFDKLISILADTNKIENTLSSKQSILILINKLFQEKLRKEYSIFAEKYNIDEKWTDEQIAKHIYRININFDIHKLAELIGIKQQLHSHNFTSQILGKEIVIEDVIELVQKENYLKNLAVDNNTTKITIRDIDVMSGSEFEHYIAKLFKSFGYKTEVTKTSGDQGIDVIAEKNGIKYAIQAKCYNSPVGNHAIMEAVAGAKYYDADQIIVITNNTFTKSAIELAQKNNVHLWDRKVLIEKISEGID